MTTLWRKFVYDSSYKPTWNVHPYKSHRFLSRYGFAFMGSLVPVGLVLINSGFLKDLDAGSFPVGWYIAGVVILSLVAWFFAVIVAAHSEQTSLIRYAFIAAAPPANLAVLFTVLQPPT